MIATAMGNPNVAARTTDGGLPPTAIQMGSEFCTGRGYTGRLFSGARNCPDQVTRSLSRILSNKSIFSPNSAS